MAADDEETPRPPRRILTNLDVAEANYKLAVEAWRAAKAEIEQLREELRRARIEIQRLKSEAER